MPTTQIIQGRERPEDGDDVQDTFPVIPQGLGLETMKSLKVDNARLLRGHFYLEWVALP